jgi:hypothetical protein
VLVTTRDSPKGEIPQALPQQSLQNDCWGKPFLTTFSFPRHFAVSKKASLSAHEHVKTHFTPPPSTSQADSAQNDGFIM